MVELVQLLRTSDCGSEGQRLESAILPQWFGIPTGRGDWLRTSIVWVQIPSELPKNYDEDTVVSQNWRVGSIPTLTVEVPVSVC